MLYLPRKFSKIHLFVNAPGHVTILQRSWKYYQHYISRLNYAVVYSPSTHLSSAFQVYTLFSSGTLLFSIAQHTKKFRCTDSFQLANQKTQLIINVNHNFTFVNINFLSTFIYQLKLFLKRTSDVVNIYMLLANTSLLKFRWHNGNNQSTSKWQH